VAGTQVLNLARFISVVKTKPLQWRLAHPYVLVDRCEPPQQQHLEPRQCCAPACLDAACAPLQLPAWGLCCWHGSVQGWGHVAEWLVIQPAGWRM
jgi:hypothetical protein